MRYQDIFVDTDYGARSKGCGRQPILHVLVVGKANPTKEIRVRHLEGELAGLEKTRPARLIVAPWERYLVSLHDEERLAVLRELSADADHIMMNAVQLVLDSSGENAVFVEIDAHATCELGPLPYRGSSRNANRCSHGLI